MRDPHPHPLSHPRALPWGAVGPKARASLAQGNALGWDGGSASSPGSRRSRQSGFTLIEMLVTLVLVGFGLALAAQLLMETSQMMVDAAGEQTKTALPLARARLRADIQSCQTAQVVPGPGGQIAELWLLGRPAGPMRYRKVGRDLVREVASAGGAWDRQIPVLRNVRSWNVLPLPGGMVAIEIHLLRRTLRRSPLPTVPGTRGPLEEERVETLVVSPRGGGLGLGW